MGCTAWSPYKLAKEIRTASEKPLDLEKYKTKRGLGRTYADIVAESNSDTAERLNVLFNAGNKKS